MGSLIKSPGGTIAPGGGYVAGRADLVAAAAARLTAPGVGLDAGCVEASTLRLQFQGAEPASCQGMTPELNIEINPCISQALLDFLGGNCCLLNALEC